MDANDAARFGPDARAVSCWDWLFKAGGIPLDTWKFLLTGLCISSAGVCVSNETEGVTGLPDTGLDNGTDAVTGWSCVEDNSENDGIAGTDRVGVLQGVGFNNETDGFEGFNQNPEGNELTALVGVVPEAVTSGVDVDNRTDGIAGFCPEVGISTVFEDALVVVAAVLCSLINCSSIFGSVNILPSKSISIRVPCSLLLIMVATTEEAAAKSASANGLTQGSWETAGEALEAELMEVFADIYCGEFCDCTLGEGFSATANSGRISIDSSSSMGMIGMRGVMPSS